MKKKIAICLNPFVSHFIPTLTFAREIENTGIGMEYIGFANMESMVVNEGFKFTAIKSCENKNLVTLEKKKAYKELGILYRKLHEEIEHILLKRDIGKVLIGISRFTLYLLPALAANVDVVFYSLCAGNPSFQLRTPPVTSNYVLTNGVIDRYMCLITWSGRCFRKGLKLNVLFPKLFYPWNELFRICKKRKISWKFGVDGYFPDFPILILGTKHFEFNSISNVCYAGLCINTKRVLKEESELLGFEEFEHAKNPLIYCSLGTLNERYQNADAFIKAVINIFNENPQWNLVLSLGKVGKYIHFDDLSNNIRIVDYVPQLQLLKHADIVLTHGGYGTVKECIYYAVPMVVFPCSYDQRGNAARVHYHKLGIASSILERTVWQRFLGRGVRKVTSDDISDLIRRILDDKQYSENIHLLRNRIILFNELKDATDFVLGMGNR